VNELDGIVAEVERQPGSTAAEIRDALRVRGAVSITEADVRRVLHTSTRLFRRDDQTPPRWSPARAPLSVADSEASGASYASDTRRALDGSCAPDASCAALPRLRTWQREALNAWRRQGHRGVVEAVTGTGKTVVGLTCAREELDRRGQVVVIVPTRELQSQWQRLFAPVMPTGTTLGLLGNGHDDGLSSHDAVIAVVNSARLARLSPRRPGGLLIADECHRYASAENRLALDIAFPRRLGLSATFARPDDGHLAWLTPYFGPICYSLGYQRALADDVIAPFEVVLIGARLDPFERGEYDDACDAMSRARAQLVARHGVPADPIATFLAHVAVLARSSDDADGVAARRYLGAMQDRRRVLDDTPAKDAVLDALVPAIQQAERTLVFTQSIAAAERASSLIRSHGIKARAIHSDHSAEHRRDGLRRFADGDVRVLVAPRVLDEGIDVPATDLAIVLGASRSRRQMVQRMGRVLRLKPDGRHARFAVVFAADTIEDPALGAHEGFLDEVTSVARTTQTFDAESSRADIVAALAADGGLASSKALRLERDRDRIGDQHEASAAS